MGGGKAADRGMENNKISKHSISLEAVSEGMDKKQVIWTQIHPSFSFLHSPLITKYTPIGFWGYEVNCLDQKLHFLVSVSGPAQEILIHARRKQTYKKDEHKYNILNYH